MIHNPSSVELDWLKRWAMYAPANIALQSGEEGRAFTYRELYARSNRVAKALRERFDVRAGDRVAAVVQNELDYITLFFATQRLNAILVPVNFRFTRSEVEHICRDSGAKLIIFERVFWSSIEALTKDVRVWNFDGPDSLIETASRKAFKEIPFTAKFEDPCMILYTSGTTGFPKGAVLSYRMLHWNSINTGLRLNLTQSDVVLTFLPLFHTGGWNVLTTPCLHRGARIVLLKKFDPELVLKLTAEQKVTVLFGVPTTMELLARSPAFAKSDLGSLRYAIVGGEPMPLPLIDVWETRGVPVRQGYGLTEFGPNVFSLNEADSRRKAGSIGFPNFYIDAKVVVENGTEATVNQIGELVLRGPVVMSGYWQNEKATNETIRDGWLHTGDLVRRDEEGYFYVVGRKKEMFISGGENVYPAEIEKVLRALPGVREAAVVGIPHQKWGECGKAFVSFEDGQSLSVEEMRDFCLDHLAKFKVPMQYVIMKDLPKTESGKISKKLLL